MRFTKEEIKKILEENWQQIENATYPEDVLTEWADGFVPIYNHEIIRDWQEMPSEFVDNWQEYGIGCDTGIISLMALDLFAYYQATTEECYREISEQLETQAQN